MIRLLAPAEVAARWPEIRPHMERALARGIATHGPADILAECLDGELACFVAEDASGSILCAIMAEIVAYPAGRHCVLAWAGGRALGRWRRAMLETIEGWARAQGARRLECFGRAGWRRVAGFRAVGLHLAKEL
ncbi:MAG: hypothetical protein KIT20_06685 [Alphaproteobacteria bacterium]|nr:hypothetical protein [Alphaproteobacteria bacterium]